MSSINDQVQVYLFCHKCILSPIYVLGSVLGTDESMIPLPSSLLDISWVLIKDRLFRTLLYKVAVPVLQKFNINRCLCWQEVGREKSLFIVSWTPEAFRGGSCNV